MKLDAMNRRNFLRTSLAVAGAAIFPAAWAAQAPRLIRARPSRAALVGRDYPQTDVWTYEGGVAGPEIRLKQGERLRIELENRLPCDTTVHCHRMRGLHAVYGAPP